MAALVTGLLAATTLASCSAERRQGFGSAITLELRQTIVAAAA